MATVDPTQRRSRAQDWLSQIPMDTDIKAPAADGSQSNPLNSEVGRNVMNTLSALPGAAAVPGAVGLGANTASRALGAAAPAVTATGRAAQALGSYTPVVGGGALLGVAASPAAQPTAAAPSPAPAAPQASSSTSTAAGAQPPSQAMATPPGTPSAAASGNVTRVGNSYSGSNISGSITVNGQAPGGGFMEGQAGPRQQMASLSTASPSVPAVATPQTANSTNDYSARKQLENLATSASSITNTQRWGNVRRGEVTPAVMAYQAALANDTALQQQQAGLDNSAMVQQANLQREGMQQQGANARSAMSGAVQMGRLNLDAEAQGYANRAAAQQEQLRGQLIDPKSTSEQRQTARQALMTLSGRQDADPYLVVPGGQQVDALSGRAYNTPSAVFNRQTGQWVQQPGQSGNLPAGMTKQVGTSGGKPVYEDASGNRFVAG